MRCLFLRQACARGIAGRVGHELHDNVRERLGGFAEIGVNGLIVEVFQLNEFHGDVTVAEDFGEFLSGDKIGAWRNGIAGERDEEIRLGWLGEQIMNGREALPDMWICRLHVIAEHGQIGVVERCAMKHTMPWIIQFP